MTTLSAHQPCYLASLQLFAKMGKSDIFMHAGHLQFQHRSWHNRNYILLNGKRKMLSIPIETPHIKPIRDARFGDDFWKKDHLKTIAQAYRYAPFFGDYYPTLEAIFYSHPHSLEQLNTDLTTTIARWLDITTHIVDSAYWHFNGDAVDMIIQMCQAVDAHTYLSTMGAKDYIGIDEELRIASSGITHEWLEFKDPDDEPLSAIHHLFNLGPEAERLIQ